MEHLFVLFSISSFNFIGGVYISPRYFSYVYKSHVYSVEYFNNHFAGHTFIICD